MTSCSNTQAPLCGVRPGSASSSTDGSGTGTSPATACAGGAWQIGQHAVTQSPAGCLSVERTASLPDGTYTNATITVLNGIITGVTSGYAVAAVLPGLCQGGGSTTGGPGTAEVDVVNDPCNMSSLQGGAIMTSLVVNPGDGISVTGCGTTADPLVITNDAIAEDGTGATVNSCGYEIVNGVVKTWTNPITTVAAGDGIKIDYNPANCKITITNTKPAAASATGTTSDSDTGMVKAEAVGLGRGVIPPDTNTGQPTSWWQLWGAGNTGYKVEALPVNSGGTVKDFTTDANGQYSEQNQLPQGMYRITRHDSNGDVVVNVIWVA